MRRLLCLSLLPLLVSCGSTDRPDARCVHNPPLSYENFGRGFLEQNCTGCHSSYLTSPVDRNYAPDSVNLDTYADAVQWALRIEARATGEAPDMPPAGGVGAEELLRLEEWLTCDLKPTAEQLELEGGE